MAFEERSVAHVRNHSILTYRDFGKLQAAARVKKVQIDGQCLDIPAVIAVSCHGACPQLNESDKLKRRIEASITTLGNLLDRGEMIYGVNTGFGGSADTRSDQYKGLQSAVLQLLQFGILTSSDQGIGLQSPSQSSHAMSPGWVRGMMLIRCNSIVRGHSGVTLRVIQAMIALLQRNMIPVIPMRGSISASGDLSPLAYVAGVVTGSPDIYVRTSVGVVTAQQALEQLQIDPIILGPKEGLALINGTAASTAVASMVLYETNQLAVLSQILTSMTTEALLGTAESFDPFLAEVRPHKGQTESATNIRSFLQGSFLARGLGSKRDHHILPGGVLSQDRYATRTASQWIGPQLEDLLLAHNQVTVELNSTTDNPIIDTKKGETHHGGNFQAVTITSAMEKTRLAVQMLGKMLFAQCSELINPMLNNNLPPNLAADEPSVSFAMKGVDIGMASYMSELAFLANPVSSHVQSAEMHNQALNSLALITSRFTAQSVELLSMMSASHLYVVCQALDLRVMQKLFFSKLEPGLCALHSEIFGKLMAQELIGEVHGKLFAHIQDSWLGALHKDTLERVVLVIDSALSILAQWMLESPSNVHVNTADAINIWRTRACCVLGDTFQSTRSAFFQQQPTSDFLGLAARRLYTFVRRDLGVPFHKGLQDHPTPKDKAGQKKKTIGTHISVIYESIRSGRIHGPLMECLTETGIGAAVGRKDNGQSQSVVEGVQMRARL